MADIAGRLRLVERKLAFLMNNMRMKAAVSSGLCDAAGTPLPPKVFEGSLAELYAMAKEMSTETAESPASIGAEEVV